MDVGTRVRLKRDVDRYPHFVAEKGMTGVVTLKSEDQIVIRLDEAVNGAEEWNNEVHWYRGMFEDKSFEIAFKEQVEVIG